MADPIAPAVKRKVKLSYLNDGLSLAAAGAKHGVSERLVFEWSRREKWVDQKLKRNGAAATSPQVKLTTFPTARGSQQAQEPEFLGDLPQSLGDLVKILDEAIARLSQSVHSPHDRRNQANAATALARLIEQRVRIADDDWLLEEVLGRFPTPAALVQALRAKYGGEAKAQARVEPLKPMTAADLAQQAIAAGVGPNEFMSHLKTAWAKSQAVNPNPQQNGKP